MKLPSKKVLIIGTAILASLVGIASRFLFKKTDNIVEEVAERIIKHKTGHDIDLSPDTPDPSTPLRTGKY